MKFTTVRNKDDIKSGKDQKIKLSFVKLFNHALQTNSTAF